MLVVMYHYVRDFDSEAPNFKNLTVDQFKKQLQFFKDNYGFITRERFLECIEVGSWWGNGVVLSFDDGFKDHYTNVLPLLEDLGLWGLFYVSSDHYHNKSCLNVHKVHHLLGRHDPKIILDASLSLVDSSMLNEDKIQEFDAEIYKDQKLSTDERSVKRLFNYYLKDEHKTKLLSEVCSNYFDEQELHDSLYLTKDELVDIENQGSIVGSHTATHPVLSTLSYADQEEEIGSSFSFLDSFLDMKVRSFCYPYGGRSSYNKDTLAILQKLNTHHAFLVGNETFDKVSSPYELTRVDCNRFNIK